MRKIIYIFARDFNQWTNQMVRQSYLTTMANLWGKGLSDQMVHYTGRIFIWYRYEDDNKALKEYMVNINLRSKVFSPKVQRNFINDVKKLRTLIKDSSATDYVTRYQKIKKIYFKLYPLYPLSIFICGPWREDFLSINKQKGEKVIELLMQSREASEGLLKEVDNFMRHWLTPLVESKGVPPEYIKLFSIEEMDSLILQDVIPDLHTLTERSRGFFYIGGLIYPIKDIVKFLDKKNITLDKPENNPILKGMAVSNGGIITGRVRVVMNSEESEKVKTGEILVTPMTAPDYLPAIMKSKAVITDEGSMSCHIAIVARELRKPAIMGIKNASSLLVDGDLIEVNTEIGEIKILQRRKGNFK